MQARTETLTTPDVDLVYDVREPSDGSAGRPPLLMAGHPMDAGGFTTLASFFPDRAVVSYDPRGLGRSVRKDGREERTPQIHATDLHALIAALGMGPVDLFATSGGAVNALALVAGHPDDVHTLVAHEPPLLAVLPDAERALAAEREVQAAYHRDGFGAGMAGFIAMTSWEGELTDEYSAQPDPDPAMFGLPTEDDGAPGRPTPLRDRQRDHQLSPRPPRLGGCPDPRGRRGRCRVAKLPRGARRGCAGRRAAPAVDGVPQPSRRLPRCGVRLPGPARGFRCTTARGPRRRRLTASPPRPLKPAASARRPSL